MPDAQNSAAAPALPRFAVLVLSLAAFASGVSLRLTDPLLPLFSREFGVSLGSAATTITAFSVAYGLSQLFFGPVGDRFGKYRVIAWACVACALTASLCGLAQGFTLLVAARLVAGATAAAIIPLSMAWIGDVVPYEQRQPVLARFLIGQILGLSTGVFVGGFAADHLSWRVPFFGIALFFIAISLGLFAINRRLPAHLGTAAAAAGPRPGLVAEFRAVIATRWARLVLGTVFCEGAALYGPYSFVAAHLHLRFGLPLARVGALVMLFAIGGLAFAFGSKRLVRRLGETGLVGAGSALMSAGLFAIAFAPAWGWAVPACLVIGLGYYMMHNTLQTQATQMAPERRGAAVAAFAACFFLGQSVGVGGVGLLIGRVGTGAALAAGGALLPLIAWRFNRQRAALRSPSVALRV